MLTPISHVLWLIAYGSVLAALYVAVNADGPTPAIVPVLAVVTLVAAVVGFLIDQKRRRP